MRHEVEINGVKHVVSNLGPVLPRFIEHACGHTYNASGCRVCPFCPRTPASFSGVRGQGWAKEGQAWKHMAPGGKRIVDDRIHGR